MVHIDRGVYIYTCGPDSSKASDSSTTSSSVTAVYTEFRLLQNITTVKFCVQCLLFSLAFLLSTNEWIYLTIVHVA